MPRPFYTRLRFILPSVIIILFLVSFLAQGREHVGIPWISGAMAGQNKDPPGIDALLNRGRALGVSLSHVSYIKEFYAAQGHAPVWVSAWGIGGQRRVNDILSVLEDSWTHGLNPLDYHVVEIRSARDNKTGEVSRDELDVTLTDAILRYGMDLSGARINKLPGIKKKDRFWRQAAHPLDILETVSKSTNTKNALRGFEPEGKL